MNDRISFEIVERIGVLETYSSGWSKEVNLVAWNGNPPKYDIRDWSEDHMHMSRGITLTEMQMNTLINLVGNEQGFTQ